MTLELARCTTFAGLALFARRFPASPKDGAHHVAFPVWTRAMPGPSTLSCLRMHKPQTLGDYQLLKRIGGGGMADIFLARTGGIAGFEKFLAIKMIRENLSDDEEFIEMLVNEAKIAVRLNHNNVVQVFDLGRIKERYYIAMEYVDGRDLQDLLVTTAQRDTYVPFEAAAYIVREACAGLHYAHTRLDENGAPLGIIHRDVSPQNILLGFNGEVKVADFGIAKANIARNETQVGILKGKFSYMSPEQAWGDKLDARSDVFSLGIVLYEMLTGEMLHQEEDQLRLLDSVRRAQIPPPTTVRREIPSDLEAITMQALERDRNERFASAGELQRELMRFLAQNTPGYGQTNLARYIQSLYKDQIAREKSEFRARNMDEETRSVSIMGRQDYVPSDKTSLVYGYEQLKADAAGGGNQDTTRPVGLRAQRDPSTLDLKPGNKPGAANTRSATNEEISIPQYDSGDEDLFEDEDPTVAYTPEEIRRAVNSGSGPSKAPRPRTPASWAAPEKEELRSEWAEPSSDSIPLNTEDLMPVSVHDRAAEKVRRASESSLEPVQRQPGPADSGRRSTDSGRRSHPDPGEPPRRTTDAPNQRRASPSNAHLNGVVPQQSHHPVHGRPPEPDENALTIPLQGSRVAEELPTHPRMGTPVRNTGGSSGQMMGLWLLVGAIVFIGIVAAVVVVLM